MLGVGGNDMAHLMIPSVVMVIIFYGLVKKVDIYDLFLEGVKEGLKMALKIFPTMFAMIVAVDLLIKSNIINDIIRLIKPIFNFLNFPSELLPLAVMRPISGNASLMIMNDLLKVYGPDSYLGRIASVIQGSTDTTIYILSLYFSSIGIKKIKYSLVVGLLSDLCTVILSIIVINLLF